MDSADRVRDTTAVVRPGAARQELVKALNAAYGAGLLSEQTLSHRLDVVLSSRLIDPVRLVGDIRRRMIRRDLASRLRHRLAKALSDLGIERAARFQQPTLLALDWGGSQDELLLGRHLSCDVVFLSLNVSRRHARLVFRDGAWILQDLGSTNGTRVNGERVGRWKLQPGDHLVLADQHLRID
jgi:hypothetical protein